MEGRPAARQTEDTMDGFTASPARDYLNEAALCTTYQRDLNLLTLVRLSRKLEKLLRIGLEKLPFLFKRHIHGVKVRHFVRVALIRVIHGVEHTIHSNGGLREPDRRLPRHTGVSD